MIMIAAAIAIVVIAAAAHRRTADESELGYVTERWLVEYRAAHGADSR
jgi:hypothetical protein